MRKSLILAVVVGIVCALCLIRGAGAAFERLSADATSRGGFMGAAYDPSK